MKYKEMMIEAMKEENDEKFIHKMRAIVDLSDNLTDLAPTLRNLPDVKDRLINLGRSGFVAGILRKEETPIKQAWQECVKSWEAENQDTFKIADEETKDKLRKIASNMIHRSSCNTTEEWVEQHGFRKFIWGNDILKYLPKVGEHHNFTKQEMIDQGNESFPGLKLTKGMSKQRIHELLIEPIEEARERPREDAKRELEKMTHELYEILKHFFLKRVEEGVIFALEKVRIKEQEENERIRSDLASIGRVFHNAACQHFFHRFPPRLVEPWWYK
jgi:hypothetical protein